jgi:hypothetical protein
MRIIRFCGLAHSHLLKHFQSNLAILLKPAPSAGSTGGVLEKVKMYYVLALVTAETKEGRNGQNYSSPV